MRYQGVFSLQNDRGTSYDMYFKVQNELTGAINELKMNWLELDLDVHIKIVKKIKEKL